MLRHSEANIRLPSHFSKHFEVFFFKMFFLPKIGLRLT